MVAVGERIRALVRIALSTRALSARLARTLDGREWDAECDCRGRLRLRGDSLPCKRPADEHHDLPLPDVPASGRFSGRRLAYIPGCAVPARCGAAVGVSFVPAGSSHLLRSVRNAAHL